MLDTVKYFLLRTRRDPKTVNSKEIGAILEAYEKHTPARIQKEINTACDRFIQQGKNLRVLYFGYITRSLSNQVSLIPFDELKQQHKVSDAEYLPPNAKKSGDGYTLETDEGRWHISPYPKKSYFVSTETERRLDDLMAANQKKLDKLNAESAEEQKKHIEELMAMLETPEEKAKKATRALWRLD